MHPKVRAGAAALCLALASALAGAVAAAPSVAETVTLTREQAIMLGRKAYLSGDAVLADAIARRLIAEDPRDVEALLLLSASEEALGRAEAAFSHGRRAWAAAKAAGRPRPLRYEIGRQAAHAALSAGRLRAAQYWLARSMDVAPDAAARAQSAQDRAAVQASTRLNFSANLQLAPTDNLSNGASTGLLIVDNTVIGGISGWSVVHAGYLASAQANATWNLGVTASDKARNSLGVGLGAVLHALTPGEAEDNPDLDAGDLDLWTLSATWTHEIALPGHDRPLALVLEASQSWYDGQPYSPTLRGKVDYTLPRIGQTEITASAVLERQWQDAPSGVVDGLNLGLDATRPVAALQAGISYGLSATLLRGDWANSTYDSFEAHLGLSPDRKFGPFQIAFSAGVNYRGYENYEFVPGINYTNARTDRGYWGQISLSTPDFSMRGLQPTLTLRSQRTRSNISKYATSSTALYFGLAAQF